MVGTFAKGKVTEDQALDRTIKWLGFTLSSKEGRFLREFFVDESVLPNDASFLVKQIWKQKPGDTKKVKTWKEAFKRDIVEDVQRQAATGINFADALAQADEIFGNTKNWFSSNPTAQKIIGKMNPENVIPNLSRLSPSQIKTIREGIIKEPGGKEAWAGFEMNFIQNIYREALTITKDTGEARVLPALLADLLNGAKAKILAINPDTWAAVKKEADFYSRVAPEFKELKLQNGMELFNAWGVLSPGSKKTLQSLAREKLIPQTFRGLSKAGLRLGGQELQLSGQ